MLNVKETLYTTVLIPQFEMKQKCRDKKLERKIKMQETTEAETGCLLHVPWFEARQIKSG